MVSPTARREAVGWLQTRGTSLRRACRVIGLSTATWRYQRRTSATNLAVLARLQAHAAVRARFVGSVDLFIIWWLVSLAIGLGVLYKKRTTPIATSLIVIYVVIGVVIAAIKTAAAGA